LDYNRWTGTGIELDPGKRDEIDYINFLFASARVFACTEVAKCQEIGENPQSLDLFIRLLERQPPDTEALWKEVQPFVEKDAGCLLLDDFTLDIPDSKELNVVYYRHWSGKPHTGIIGINLISLVWIEGDMIIPIDFRIYDINHDGKTKNYHFREMLTIAYERGFNPRFVMFDRWYGSIVNLKLLRDTNWHWLTRLKKNRQVNPDRTYNRQICEIEIPPPGRVVHLKEYGMIKVFGIWHSDDDKEFWATDDLDMDENLYSALAKKSAKIEQYPREIK
jgi:hypothetical protein